MSYAYIINSLILYLLFKIVKIISNYFLISQELHKISSLPLTVSIQLNIKNYLLGVPLVTNIRNHLLEPLEETGIVKYYDILWQRWIIFVSRPDLLKEINSRPDAFQKIDAAKRPMSECEFAYIGRKNILFENKEEHLRHRRIANPSFHHTWPTELFGDIIKELFEELDKDFKINSTINIQGVAQSFTLEALGKAAFGYNFGAIRKPQTEIIKAYNATMRGISNTNYVLFPILERIPGFRRTHLLNNIKFLNNVILDIINKRKRKQQTLGNVSKNKNVTSMDNYTKDNVILSPEIEFEKSDLKHNDLLSYMLKAEADETNLKKRLSTEELLNDLKVFLIAGHDSTATAISAAIYYLGKNPDYQKKVREEVISIIGDKEGDVIPTLEQIKEMKYINMVINETLRIHPPAPATNARIAQKEAKLGEYVIPKGQMIIPNLYALHHSRKLWGDESHKFRPERFEKEISQPYNFIPFGGGVRICIGMNFSLAEQRVFLAMFVRKYQWIIPKETIHDDKIEVNKTYLSLLVPKNMYVTFERRY